MENAKRTALGFRDLEIYRKSHALAVAVHKMTFAELPPFEKYEQGSQVRRSAKSVVANMVEGFGRRAYKADFIRFLHISHASCDETMAHLKLLEDTGSLASVRARELSAAYDALGRQLHAFTAGVEREHMTA